MRGISSKRPYFPVLEAPEEQILTRLHPLVQAPTIAPAIRFHLSLNVTDLARAVAFYRTLFGVDPAKQRGDYAKFELDDPPVVLSLEATPHGAGGALNHLGFRMPDATALVAMQERLERAGIRSQREEGVECCYARQTKFWVTDPDGTLWEIYTLEGDLDHRGVGQSLEQMVPDADRRPTLNGTTTLPTADLSPSVYEHILTDAGALSGCRSRDEHGGRSAPAWHVSTCRLTPRRRITRSARRSRASASREAVCFRAHAGRRTGGEQSWLAGAGSARAVCAHRG